MRDAHILSGLMEWSAQLSDTTLKQTMLGFNLNTNPMWPMLLPFMKPLLLNCIPIDEATYERIVQVAEMRQPVAESGL